MPPVQIYRTTLRQIIAENDNSEDLELSLHIEDNQLPIFNLLNREQSIEIVGVNTHREDMVEQEEYGGGKFYPAQEGYFVRFRLHEDLGGDDFPVMSVEQRLEDLNSWLAEHQEWLNDIERVEIIILREVGGFALFADGFITYQGRAVSLREQLYKTLTVFMETEGRSLSYNDLRNDGVVDENAPENTIRRYIYELNRELENLTGYRPIVNRQNMGWRIEPNG